MNTPVDQLDTADPGPPDDVVTAGEFVLGVLDRDERARVQARIARDPAFAALVDAWESRFSSWAMRVQAVEPGPQVWPRIRTQLGWAAVEAAPKGVWTSVAFWRGATALAAAASVVAIVLMLQKPLVPAPSPPTVVVRPSPDVAAKPVTVLARDDGSTGWIARIDPATGKVLMVPVPSPADARGRVHELWIIP